MPEADQVVTGCINVWSGPRCVSTSLMYSWAQRSDTTVSGIAGGPLPPTRSRPPRRLPLPGLNLLDHLGYWSIVIVWESGMAWLLSCLAPTAHAFPCSLAPGP